MKLASQMPSSTSLMPSFWPASTVEMLIRLRCRQRRFRLTFATWAEECTDYPDGVREAALAHKYKSETTAAYQRGQKLEKRRVLMKDWAQFVEGSNVIRFGKIG